MFATGPVCPANVDAQGRKLHVMTFSGKCCPNAPQWRTLTRHRNFPCMHILVNRELWINVTSALPVRKGCKARASALQPEGVIHMKASLNVAENGGGSYRLLAILRWVMVVIFVSFGMQKFTLQSAQGIVQVISNSPFVSWLSLFGFRGKRISSVLSSLPLRRCLRQAPSARPCQPSVRWQAWSLLRSRGRSSSPLRESFNGACRPTR
jgi:hypothetical protein